MKYNIDKFNQTVKEYKKLLNVQEKNILISFDALSFESFISIAPLSKAIHELNNDLHVIGISDNSESLDAIKDVWSASRSKYTKASDKLTEFIEIVGKKCEGKFRQIFTPPDLIFKQKNNSFMEQTSRLKLPVNGSWFKKYRLDELKKTFKPIWKEVYNIQPTETVGVGFPLIQKDELLGHPLEDYLDSYSIIWSALSTLEETKFLISSATQRESMLEPCERVSDLKTTLLGCELEKNIDEPIFQKYNELSTILKLDRIKPVDASFFIGGKGYPGKHLFGERIGYPTLNKKSRWQSPGQLIYKLDFYPQTQLEERDPKARVAFTDTLPIDIFIETNLIDWNKLRSKNNKVKSIMDKCDKIIVKSNINENHKTELEVGLTNSKGVRRWVKTSDTDVREKINQEYQEKTGIKAGCMANIPGGEAFVTPETIKGKFVGDVVVHIDQSYVLDKKDPLVVECDGSNYRIISGPKNIIEKLNKRKKESLELLEETEKHKSLPQELIDLKKSNFERIGEFAINTNPKAKLCDYLIVNEKIAKMMHIALGSGYEPDRSTEYHMDIVFNAPRQKLDVYGLDNSGKQHWILKKGEFVF